MTRVEKEIGGLEAADIEVGRQEKPLWGVHFWMDPLVGRMGEEAHRGQGEGQGGPIWGPERRLPQWTPFESDGYELGNRAFSSRGSHETTAPVSTSMTACEAPRRVHAWIPNTEKLIINVYHFKPLHLCFKQLKLLPSSRQLLYTGNNFCLSWDLLSFKYWQKGKCEHFLFF